MSPLLRDTGKVLPTLEEKKRRHGVIGKEKKGRSCPGGASGAGRGRAARPKPSSPRAMAFLSTRWEVIS